MSTPQPSFCRFGPDQCTAPNCCCGPTAGEQGSPPEPQWVTLLFHTWVDDPKNDGTYVLNLDPEQTELFFQEIARLAPARSQTGEGVGGAEWREMAKCLAKAEEELLAYDSLALELTSDEGDDHGTVVLRRYVTELHARIASLEAALDKSRELSDEHFQAYQGQRERVEQLNYELALSQAEVARLKEVVVGYRRSVIRQENNITDLTEALTEALAAARPADSVSDFESNLLLTGGAGLIAQERKRGIMEEGFDAGHDDEHDEGELAQAAASYIEGSNRKWPFELGWFKPTGNRVRDLTIAGALLAAEIDRLQRLTKGSAQAPRPADPKSP